MVPEDNVRKDKGLLGPVHLDTFFTQAFRTFSKWTCPISPLGTLLGTLIGDVVF